MRVFPLTLAFLAAGSASAADSNDLEKRVEALELSSYTNTVSFSGFLESRFETGTKKPDTGDKVTHTVSTLLGGIDFKSTLNDRVSVFGRWVFSSAFNATNADSAEATSNFADGRSYVDSQAYFERFFANIKIIDNLQFTFGRLPTLDGPPAHFADGLARQGTYPKWAYSAILDGYALTYNYPISTSQSLSVRAIYSPATYLNPSFGAGTDFKFQPPQTDAGVDENGAVVKEAYRDKVEINSQMLDYNNSAIGFAKDFNAIYQRVGFKKFQFATTLDADFDMNLFYVEANQLANTGLSLWLSYSMTEIKNHGYIGVPYTTPVAGVAKIGLLGGPDSTAKGKGSAVGLRYALPIEVLKNPAIGAEYVNNDKNYVLFELTPRTMFDFYGIHGKATHIYWSQPIYSNVKLRLGTMMLTPDYNWGYVGAPVENKDKYSSLYANIRVDF